MQTLLLLILILLVYLILILLVRIFDIDIDIAGIFDIINVNHIFLRWTVGLNLGRMQTASRSATLVFSYHPLSKIDLDQE